MNIITIDNGNTNTSVGIFKDGTLTQVIPFKNYIKNPNDFILISSVGAPLDLKPSVDLKKFRSPTSFFDMPVSYSQTLGEDRLVASYYIYKKLNPKEKVLLIDSGTFMTCDLISHNGFEGGYILPGLDKFLSLYSQGKQLLTFTKTDIVDFNLNGNLPQNTKDAILEATKLTLKSALLNIISAASPDRIILTGGNANEIKKLISLEAHVELDHHLVHLALELIHQVHLQTS